MHVSVRRFPDLGRRVGKLAPLIRAELVPCLKQTSGFLGHCTIASEDDHLIILSVARNRPSAIEIDARIGRWMRPDATESASTKMDVTSGEALLHEVASIQRENKPAMFGVVRFYDGIGPRDEILPLVREHVFLTITGAAGFRGYYAFIDERKETRGVAVSLFDSRDHALEANERVVAVMRDRHIAPNAPSIVAGPTIGVAAASQASPPTRAIECGKAPRGRVSVGYDPPRACHYRASPSPPRPCSIVQVGQHEGEVRMRRITVAAAAFLAALAGVPSSPAEASQSRQMSAAPNALVQPVNHYYAPYGGGRYYGGGERRGDWHAYRRAEDRARIAEAARREAMRIERERAARRAWHQAHRQQYGWHRGW